MLGCTRVGVENGSFIVSAREDAEVNLQSTGIKEEQWEQGGEAASH